MKSMSVEDAATLIPDGAVLMVGGFMGVGTPELLMDELVRQGKRDLTVIGNDTAIPGVGFGKLISAGLCSRGVASARRIIVAMQHTAKGRPKIVKACNLPLTSSRPIDVLVTELAVIACEEGRLVLRETAQVSPSTRFSQPEKPHFSRQIACRKWRSMHDRSTGRAGGVFLEQSQ